MKPPSGRKTSYTAIQGELVPPRILISRNADLWIRLLAEEHDEEIGFFGIVDEKKDGEEIVYVVREIFYPKHQLVTSGTCEISGKGEAEMGEWLMDHRCDEDVGKIRFWGHSHHTMGTTPSGQDDQQALERMSTREAYVLRAICNKSGEMSISFYDYDRLLRFDDIQFDVEGDPTEDKIRAKIRELKKVNVPSKVVIPVSNSSLYTPSGVPDGVYRGRYNEHQQSMWPPSGPGSSRQTAVTNNPTAGVTDKPESVEMNQSEIDTMLMQWERGIG